VFEFVAAGTVFAAVSGLLLRQLLISRDARSDLHPRAVLAAATWVIANGLAGLIVLIWMPSGYGNPHADAKPLLLLMLRPWLTWMPITFAVAQGLALVASNILLGGAARPVSLMRGLLHTLIVGALLSGISWVPYAALEGSWGPEPVSAVLIVGLTLVALTAVWSAWRVGVGGRSNLPLGADQDVRIQVTLLASVFWALPITLATILSDSPGGLAYPYIVPLGAAAFGLMSAWLLYPVSASATPVRTDEGATSLSSWL
jgi:hypothetical protein